MAVKSFDLNRASVEEITGADIAGVGEGYARSLVDYRDENGPFESWDEVSMVPGFNDQLIMELQEEGVWLGRIDEDDTD